MPELAGARTVRLAWDPNHEPNVAGYRLRYGIDSGSYTKQINVGNTSSATVKNLVDGTTYFFVVSAYDSKGLESRPSHEISYPASDHVRNLSTRGALHLDGVLISGFVITGNGQKKLVVRALGPSLPVPQGLSDPILELHDVTGATIATNDDWGTWERDAIVAAGLAPSNDRDAALIATLNSGSYTVVVRDVNAAAGIGLVEIYDLDDSRDTTRLSNGSARGSVLTGDNVLIGGIIIGVGDRRTKILSRALGPSLVAAGVPYALSDPTLRLYDVNGTMIASNDNWKDTQQAEVEAIGMAPADDRESAILMAFSPGNYTAIVAGKDGGMGVGLVEIYSIE